MAFLKRLSGLLPKRFSGAHGTQVSDWGQIAFDAMPEALKIVSNGKRRASPYGNTAIAGTVVSTQDVSNREGAVFHPGFENMAFVSVALDARFGEDKEPEIIEILAPESLSIGDNVAGRFSSFVTIPFGDGTKYADRRVFLPDGPLMIDHVERLAQKGRVGQSPDVGVTDPALV